MTTIPAREIKRRGISAVDDALKNGPVHVIQNDCPKYVIMDEAQYEELREANRKEFVAGVRRSLAEMKAGRVRKVTARQLKREIGLND